MRRRPNKDEEQKFINQAKADFSETQTIKEDLHKYVRKSKWPISNEDISPSFAEGSSLRKPWTIPLKEYEWNSIDRHTKAIGVQKSEWIRHAMFRLMQEEQIFFLKHKDDDHY
jgi:hypothetical protein